MIYSLKDCKKIDEQFGNKAINLAKLMNNHMVKIPKGFAISIDLYKEFLKYNNFSYTDVDYLKYNEEIIEFIENAQFSKLMEQELFRFFSELTQECQSIVVRSSSIVEDSTDFSFAGLFETYLNINTFAEFLICIKKCYSSMFSERVLNYFESNSISYENLKMGVLVQEYIVGEKSGVVFTASTVDMNNNVIINSVSGQCEKLVSGKEKSNHYEISRTSIQNFESREYDDNAALSKSEISTIVAVAVDIEKIFQKYQDIEWTLSDNNLYILQARPITTYEDYDKELTWLTENNSELEWEKTNVFNSPLYNIEEKLLETISTYQGKGIYKRLGFCFEYRIENGHIFKTKAKEASDDEKRTIKAKVSEKTKDLFSKGENLFSDTFHPKIKQKTGKLKSYYKNQLSAQDIEEYLKEAVSYYGMVSEMHTFCTLGESELDKFYSFCREIDSNFNRDDFYNLIFNTSILSEERELLLKIASIVKSTDINQLFKKFKYSKTIFHKLEKSENGKKVLVLIDEYLEKFGQLSTRAVINICAPSYLEKPEKVLDKVRSVLNHSLSDFLLQKEKIFSQKHSLISSLTKNLNKNDLLTFNTLLKAAEKFFLSNDNHSFYIDKSRATFYRLAFLEAADYLEKEKIILSKDIFYLNYDEVITLLQGQHINELTKLISNRKKEFKRYRTAIVPDKIGSVKAVDKTDNKKTINDEVILSGVANTKAIIKGKAKVIDAGWDDIYLEGDAILIMSMGHGTDILSVLDKVKGVIYDYNSPYDHVAVLVKEFGIPAIYNTKNATSLIKNGQVVKIDGKNNQVKIYK